MQTFICSSLLGFFTPLLTDRMKPIYKKLYRMNLEVIKSQRVTVSKMRFINQTKRQKNVCEIQNDFKNYSKIFNTPDQQFS